MATVAGVDFGLERADFAAAAAFRLSASAIEDASVRPGEGALVEIHPEAGVVLVFLAALTDESFAFAHEAAQRALDIEAFSGRGAATLPRAHDEYVYWRRDGDEIILSVVATKEVPASLGVKGERRGPDGEVVESPPPPESEWTQALRFFRQSQVAEDVFDAYRSAFLALEAILSDLVAGGPKGERAWLVHALRDVEKQKVVEIARYVKGGDADPVDSFMDEQYKALRCATFHAKGHRKVLLPGSLGDREQVGQALESLTRLVIDLAPTVVKTKYLGGALTSAGFEGLYVAPKVGKMELFAARHDHGKLAERVALDCQYVGRLDDQGFEYGFLGEAAVRSLVGRSTRS